MSCCSDATSQARRARENWSNAPNSSAVFRNRLADRRCTDIAAQRGVPGLHAAGFPAVVRMLLRPQATYYCMPRIKAHRCVFAKSPPAELDRRAALVYVAEIAVEYWPLSSQDLVQWLRDMRVSLSAEDNLDMGELTALFGKSLGKLQGLPPASRLRHSFDPAACSRCLCFRTLSSSFKLA